MDSTIYALVIPALIATIGLTRPEAGYLATAALVGAAVGGWGAGILADRIGRVRILQLTILWVALCTLAAAFATGFNFLFIIRFLQGLGYGGEAAVGGVLISEVIRPHLRGRVAASVQSSYAVGYAISVSLLPIIFSLFSEDVGWRVFFGIGRIPAGPYSSSAGWRGNLVSIGRLAPPKQPVPRRRLSGQSSPVHTCAGQPRPL
jgi:MFS family permease